MERGINKAVNVLDTMVNTVVVIICLLILFISGYSLLDNVWQVQGASDDSLLAFKPVLDEPIKQEQLISGNQVAWLTIDDTAIDYPVMQGEDNFEYLNKDPYGEFKLSGSIFLDHRNSPDFTDEYSVIYGHHMEHGVMFGSLDAFKDKSYFDTHTKGHLATGEKVYDITLFAVSSADAMNGTLFDPQGRTTSEITDFLKENAIIYNEPEEGRSIIALSTCAGETYYARLLVFGTIKER
ncbi:MAG: class B sortase [Oscillospiraceae bacterium]|nr:class B sortase [Oscillospiraceae bacterium]